MIYHLQSTIFRSVMLVDQHFSFWNKSNVSVPMKVLKPKLALVPKRAIKFDKSDLKNKLMVVLLE